MHPVAFGLWGAQQTSDNQNWNFAPVEYRKGFYRSKLSSGKLRVTGWNLLADIDLNSKKEKLFEFPAHISAHGPMSDFTSVDDNLMFVAAEQGRIHRSADGGKTWTFQSLPAGKDALLSKISFVNKNFGVATGQSVIASQTDTNGAFYVSVDEGVTWEYRAVGYSEIIVDHHFLTDKIGAVGFKDGTVRTTTDGGLTWSTPEVPPFGITHNESVEAIAFASAQKIWAIPKNKVSGAQVYLASKSEDGGKTWASVILNADLLVAGQNFRAKSLYIKDEKNIFIGGCYLVEYTELGKGCDLGVAFYTKDGGTIWNKAEAPASGRILEFSTSDKGAVLATTENGSVLEFIE